MIRSTTKPEDSLTGGHAASEDDAMFFDLPSSPIARAWLDEYSNHLKGKELKSWLARYPRA